MNHAEFVIKVASATSKAGKPYKAVRLVRFAKDGETPMGQGSFVNLPRELKEQLEDGLYLINGRFYETEDEGKGYGPGLGIADAEVKQWKPKSFFGLTAEESDLMREFFEMRRAEAAAEEAGEVPSKEAASKRK